MYILENKFIKKQNKRQTKQNTEGQTQEKIIPTGILCKTV